MSAPCLVKSQLNFADRIFVWVAHVFSAFLAYRQALGYLNAVWTKRPKRAADVNARAVMVAH
jgi:hypothetical protein